MNSARKVIDWLHHKIAYSVGFGVVVLLLVGTGLFFFSGARKGSPKVIKIAYGAGAPVRKHFLEEMAAHGKGMNLDIRLVVTEDSDHTLNLIHQNDVDMGLIVGAIEDQASRDVHEISPLYMESLQLLVREELYEAVSKDFGQLRGKSISMDSPESATALLATELLSFMGLTDLATGKLQYQPLYVTQTQIMDLKSGASMPDAIFQIGGIPSRTIRSLVTDKNYRLVPLPFSESFSLDKFRETETPGAVGNSNLRLNKSFIEESVIPAFTYGVLPAVPPKDARTVASRLVLIGSPRVDVQTVHKVLDLIFSPEISNLSKPPLTVELLNSSYQFERHPGTDQYLSSKKPIDVDGIFATYGRLGEVWGILITLYFTASKGLKSFRERKQRIQRKSVGDFLREILDVESAANASCSNEDRIMLDQKLSDIKKTSIELNLAGGLEDPENFHSLLVSLADARNRVWETAS